MAFNGEEKDFLNTIFENPTGEEKLKTILPDFVFDFLKSRNHINTIQDRIIFREANEFRPFSSCIFTKFILPETNLKEILTELVEIITPDYLLFVDFHFLVNCNGKDNEGDDFDEEPVFKFQRGSKTSCINETIKMFNTSDLENFLQSFKGFQNSDFLNQAFISHSEIFDFRSSGLRPYCLLSLLVHLQKIK